MNKTLFVLLLALVCAGTAAAASHGRNTKVTKLTKNVVTAPKAYDGDKSAQAKLIVGTTAGLAGGMVLKVSAGVAKVAAKSVAVADTGAAR